MTFDRACEILRELGCQIEPSDIPGLTLVDGVELTVRQVIHCAVCRQPPRQQPL